MSQSTNQLTSEIKAGFSTVSSQSTVSESANEARHQVALTRFDDQAGMSTLNGEKMDKVLQQQARSMDINEAGFQAVHTGLISAASSNMEEHKTTHAMLSQYQGHIQQMIRNHISFGAVDQRVHSSPSRARASVPTTMEATVFWKHSWHRTPIGMLKISLIQTRQTRNSRRSMLQECEESQIAVEFVPPWWLSTDSDQMQYQAELRFDQR